MHPAFPESGEWSGSSVRTEMDFAVIYHYYVRRRFCTAAEQSGWDASGNTLQCRILRRRSQFGLLLCTHLYSDVSSESTARALRESGSSDTLLHQDSKNGLSLSDGRHPRTCQPPMHQVPSSLVLNMQELQEGSALAFPWHALTCKLADFGGLRTYHTDCQRPLRPHTSQSTKRGRSWELGVEIRKFISTPRLSCKAKADMYKFRGTGG
jgi:hypothetical protein